MYNNHSKNISNIILIAIISLFFSSCQSFDTAIDEERKNDPAYVAGYRDGCIYAKKSTTDFGLKSAKLDEKYKENPNYKYGFRKGNLECAPLNNGSNDLNDKDIF